MSDPKETRRRITGIIHTCSCGNKVEDMFLSFPEGRKACFVFGEIKYCMYDGYAMSRELIWNREE